MTNEDNKKPLNPKREALIKLSNEAFDFRESQIKMASNLYEVAFWEGKTLNYIMLHHLYKTNDASEFNTFNQWKEKGATIAKGSKAFAIWGQPIRAKEKAEQLQDEKKDKTEDYQYFPMCFLFSDKQVIFPSVRETTSIDNADKNVEASIDDFM